MRGDYEKNATDRDTIVTNVNRIPGVRADDTLDDWRRLRLCFVREVGSYVVVLLPPREAIRGSSIASLELLPAPLPLTSRPKRDAVNRSFAKRDKSYQAIIDALPQMVGIFDAAATLLTVNAQWRAYTGAPVDERGVPTDGFPVHADDRETAAAMLAAIGPNCDLHGELRMRRADATYRRHDVRVIPLDAHDKKRANRWLVVCTDVESQRTILSRLGVLAKQLTFDNASDKASTVRLREKTQLMAIVERMSHLGHWRLDLNSDELYLSDELRRTFGLPATFTPTLLNVIACYHPEDRNYVRADIQDAVAQATTFTHEARIVRPDGALRHVLSYGQPECASDGTVVAIVGCVQDVTATKQLALAREQIAERISVATATARVGIWEFNALTATLIWDPIMYALYGFDDGHREQTYDGWSASLHKDDRVRVERDIARSLSRGAPYDTEFRAIWPNGEVHSIRAMATIVSGATESAQRMIGTSWDVTEMRRLDKQLRHEKDQLAETVAVWTAAKVISDEAQKVSALHASERERLYQHERQWSAKFQRAVLPAELPDVPGCSFDAVYEPGFGDGQVGGDWYDAVHVSDGRILVSIGDVAGSGLQAAVVVGVARQIIRGISQLHADPVLILDAADRALRLEYPGVYVSAWVGLIDLVTRTVTYASAGHPLPLLVSHDGAVRELDDATTMLIGMRTERHGKASTAVLAQGDALVLYTDGITEAGRDIIAGTRALSVAAARYAPAPSRHPALAIKCEVIPEGSPDDAALLVLRTDFREAERFIERWTFDVHDANAATDARAQFVRSLASRGFCAAACSNAEVVFGELIGNVVRHANAAEVEVAVNYGAAKTVLHVMDHGGGFNHVSRLPRDPYAENGRGLFLIAALTDEFTVSERPDGGSHARAVLVRTAA